MKQNKYAGIFPRVKAVSIDGIVIIIFLIIITDIFSLFDQVPNWTRMLAFVLIFGLYEPLMISFFGATIGHKITNLKVQNLDNKGNLSFVQALIRYLIKFFLGWISLLTIASNDKKQAIHDQVVHSVVLIDH